MSKLALLLNIPFYNRYPLQEIMVKNISPAQREKPHNEVDILFKGASVLEILEKELIALSGLCLLNQTFIIKKVLVIQFKLPNFFYLGFLSTSKFERSTVQGHQILSCARPK